MDNNGVIAVLDNGTVGENKKRLGWLAPLLIVLSLLGIVGARATAEQFDFAVANIITLICGFVFVVTVGTLFLRHGQIPVAYKIGVVATPILLMAVGLLFFKPIGVDSELIPRFKYRWSKAATPVVVKPAASDSEKQPEVSPLIKQGPRDYPGFLGGDRRATLAYSFTDPAEWSAETPELLWKSLIGAGWSAFSVVGEIAVTLEQKEEQEVLQAYELKTGKPLWSNQWATKHATSLGGLGPRSTPTIADGMVFAQGANGHLVAAKLETGETVWDKDLLEVAGVQLSQAEAEVAWGRSSSPLVIDGKLIIPLGGAVPKLTTLICFEAATGKELWRSGSEQVSYASPTLMVLQNVPQIVSVNNDSVSSHRIEDGVVLWETPWPGASNGPANVSQPVAIDSERILLSKAYGSGAKMLKVKKGADDQWNVETVWENPSVLKTKFTNVVVHEGYAYGLSDGILECVDLATGDRKWKSKRYRHGQIMLVGDHLLVVAEDGSVALGRANPEKFVESYRFQAIEGMTWNNPALAGDLLLVRNGEQAACYRLPLEKSESR
jgi:outer membrane protein assembly factor BamB